MCIPAHKKAQAEFAERVLNAMQEHAEPIIMAEAEKGQPPNFIPNVTLMLGAMMLHKGVRTCVGFARDQWATDLPEEVETAIKVECFKAAQSILAKFMPDGGAVILRTPT